MPFKTCSRENPVRVGLTSNSGTVTETLPPGTFSTSMTADGSFIWNGNPLFVARVNSKSRAEVALASTLS